MSFFKRMRFLILVGGLLAVAAPLAFVACEDEKKEEGGTPTPTATATATVTVAPTLSPQAERPATAQEVQEQQVEASDGVIEVEQQDFEFVANHFRVDEDQAVTFNVTNNGAAPHTFTIAGIDGQFGTIDDLTTDQVAAGSTESLEVTFDIPGTYVFRCDVHPDQMWGETRVSAAESAPGTPGY